MNNDTTPPFEQQGGLPMQIPLPNSTVVLVCGILSIVTCCCYGIVGLGLGITALILGNKDIALYNSNPLLYTAGSLSNTKTGRICAIIGLILSALYLLYIVVILVVFGSAFLTDPQKMQEIIQGFSK